MDCKVHLSWTFDDSARNRPFSDRLRRLAEKGRSVVPVAALLSRAGEKYNLSQAASLTTGVP
jgi:hypothetical protein